MRLGTCPFSFRTGREARPVFNREKGAPSSYIRRPIMRLGTCPFSFRTGREARPVFNREKGAPSSHIRRSVMKPGKKTHSGGDV